MKVRRALRASVATALLSMLRPALAAPAPVPTFDADTIGLQPRPSSQVAPYVPDLAKERALGLTHDAAVPFRIGPNDMRATSTTSTIVTREGAKMDVHEGVREWIMTR